MGISDPNALLVDQHCRGLAERHREQLEPHLDQHPDQHLDGPPREQAEISAAFAVLCVKSAFHLSGSEAISRLTARSGEVGVDAMEIGSPCGGEFSVTLFLCKYHHANLEGTKQFPTDDVEKAVQAVSLLFNSPARLDVIPSIRARAAVIRARMLDGYVPRVRFLLCSNGQAWKASEANPIIARAAFGDRVFFEHVNHDTLIRWMSGAARIDETLQLVGRAHVREGHYSRTFHGTMTAGEVSRLLIECGSALFDDNLRRYLGPYENEVNASIRQTLENEERRKDFYLFNNGITFVCERFEYNALQSENHRVRVEHLRLVNGGQTSQVIAGLLANWPQPWASEDEPQIAICIHQIGGHPDAAALANAIALSTNRQTRIDLFDMHANEEEQQRLEASLGLLGFRYLRQRGAFSASLADFTVSEALTAVLAVWRGEPQWVNARSSELFDKKYKKVFTKSLNGAQVAIACALLRTAEKRVRHPLAEPPEFLQHATGFLAMVMGKRLLRALKISVHQLDHRNFQQAHRLMGAEGERFFEAAVSALQHALERYRRSLDSTPRLIEIFQRGVLLEYLNEEEDDEDE